MKKEKREHFKQKEKRDIMKRVKSFSNHRPKLDLDASYDEERNYQESLSQFRKRANLEFQSLHPS